MFALVGVFALGGCSSLAKQVARDATPEAVNSGIEAGLSEENQEKIVKAIEPERIERATDQVLGAATDGWSEAMADPARQQRIAEALAPIVVSLVDTSWNAALSDEHLTRIRELSKQATLGFQDAIDEVTQKQDSGEMPADEGNVLEAVDDIAEGGGTALYVLGAIAALLALLVAIGIAWALHRRRRYEGELMRRNNALEAAIGLLTRHGIALDEGDATQESSEAKAKEDVAGNGAALEAREPSKDAPRADEPRPSGAH